MLARTSDKHSKWKRQRVHRGDNGHGLEEIRLLLKGNLTKFDEDEADNTQDADGVTRNNEIAEPSGLRKLNILPTSGTGVESEGIPLRPRQDFEKYTQDIRWSKRVSLDQRYEHELTHKAAMVKQSPRRARVELTNPLREMVWTEPSVHPLML